MPGGRKRWETGPDGRPRLVQAEEAGAVAILEKESEFTRVVNWRLQQLLEAGYPLEIAERLAAEIRVDLHEACDLLRKGCDPETALSILL